MDHDRPPFELDPFALPAETKGRFRMLIAAAAVFAWSLAAWLIHVPNLYTRTSPTEDKVHEIVERFRQSGDPATVNIEDLRTIYRSKSAQEVRRRVVYQAARILVSCAMFAFFILGTWLVYARHPALERRRHDMRPLTEPAAVDEVRRLAEQAGLSSELRLEYKPGMLDGVAFGRRGREVLALAGNRRLLASPWTDEQRAVALHEIGHVVNDDVRTREVARAGWIVLPALAAITGAVLTLVSLADGELRFPAFQAVPLLRDAGTGAAAGLLRTGVKTAAMFFAIWWTWAGLIRARETYADWRVVSWGFEAPLMRLLRLPEAHQPRWRRLRLWRRYRERPWWRKACAFWDRYGWRRHPSNAARRQMLGDPTALFKTGPDLAFLTGLLLTLVAGQLTPLATDLTFLAALLAAPLFFLVGPLALLVHVGIAMAVMLGVTYLVAGALGVQVQRQAIADLATRPHHEWGYFRLGRTALFFAVGLEAGLFVSPFGPFTMSRAPLWVVAWLFGLAFLIWIWLLYLRAASRLFLGAQTRASAAKWTQRTLTGISTFLLAVLLWPALALRLTIEVAHQEALLAAMTPTYSDPQEHFVAVFVMSSLVLFSISFGFYILVAGSSVLGAGVWHGLRGVRCSRCAAQTTFRLVVGRKCSRCGESLATWPFLDPALRRAVP